MKPQAILSGAVSIAVTHSFLHRCCWLLRVLGVCLCVCGFARDCAFARAESAANAAKGQEARGTLAARLQIGDGARTSYHIGEVVPIMLIVSSRTLTKTQISYERCPEEEPYPAVQAPVLLNRKYLLETPGDYPLSWSGEIFGRQLTTAPVTLTVLTATQARAGSDWSVQPLKVSCTP
jgi:hypothetical protein